MVLKHWACAKITRSKPLPTGTGKDGDLTGDDNVCKLIVDKFEKLGGGSVSYADIAKKAWEVGRPVLATKVRRPSCHFPPAANATVASGLRAQSLGSSPPPFKYEGGQIGASESR
jgi:hypothetical protein